MDLTSILLTPLRWLGAGLCNIIYFLISRLFQLFMIVSQLNILSSDEIGPIYERITLILTIVMVFYITFEFVKYVVQPDAMTDKEKGVGNIVKRMIIAIVLIAFVPRIFTMAYDIQNKLITNQVFSKIILGEKNIDFDTFGSTFSADMLGVFYGLDEEYCSGDNYDDKCQEAEKKVEDNLAKLREGNKVTIMPGLTTTKDFTIDGSNEKVFPVRFDGLMAIIIGGVILYLVVLYTIDVGTRYAQLIFLQIMSPIAIIGYISPKKDNIFSKWLKQCVTTYLDLFIRLTIIYFILLIIDVLGDSFTSGSLFAGVEGVEGYKTLAYIALVMGLLVFAQKAPKMIGELLPTGGAASIGYGLKGGDRFSPAWNAAKRTVSGTARTLGAGWGAGSAVREWIKNPNRKNMRTRDSLASLAKGIYSGVKAGAGKSGTPRKGATAARDSIKNDNAIFNAGGTVTGHDIRASYYASESVRQDEQIEQLESMTKTKKAVSTSIENIKFRKQMDKMGEALVASGNAEAAKAWDGEKKAAEKLTRMYASGTIDQATYTTRMENLATSFNQKYNLTGTGAAVAINSEDLELDSTAKWSSVSTALNEAKKQAIDVAKRNISYKTKDKNGNDVDVEIKYVKDESTGKEQQIVTYKTTDSTGNVTTETKEYDFAQFGEKIGDLTDIAESAVVDIKASDEYKKAHANAQGASGKSGK